jgi:hypothetical protein
MPTIGTCFQLLLSEESEENHFWIVISKPIDGRVLVANLTDRGKCPDSPCQFVPNEHPVITKASAIYYYKARTFEVAAIDAQLQSQRYVRQLPPFPPDLVKRIIEGTKVAEDLTLKLLKYLD